MTVASNAPQSADKKVNQRADEMREQNDQDPDDLVAALIAFLRRAIHQHPDPEDGSEQTEWQDEQQRENFDNAESDHAEHNFPFVSELNRWRDI